MTINDPLAVRTNDPRGNPNNLQFDPAFAAETDRLYQNHYGGGPAPQPQPQRQQPSSGSAPLTAQQLAVRTNDPRGNPNNLQFDPAFAAETDRLYQQAYPDSSSANPTNPKQPASVADQVPAEASGYRLGESEKLAPFAKQLEGDELWGTARKLARDAGLSQKQFAGFVTPVLEMIAERDGGSVNYQAELKKLTPADALHLDEHGQRASAGRRVQAALSFLEQDAVAAGLDPQLAEFVIEQLGESERGIRAIEFFRSRLGGNR